MIKKSIKEKAVITAKEILAPDIYRLRFSTDLCRDAAPGQFMMIYPKDSVRLLGRPICIADVDTGNAAPSLSVVFRISGGGTGDISSCDKGDTLYLEGPLGHGYPLDKDLISGKRIVLLGGGLGAPSLLFLAKKLLKSFPAGKTDGMEITAVLGYRDSGLKHFLAQDFETLGIKTVITTDDGSEGLKGNVLDALRQKGICPDLIYACGPMPMLSAVKKYAASNASPAYISLEEHMACGIGVCLGCVVKTAGPDPHSKVCNARVCTEGPVFDASEVDI